MEKFPSPVGRKLWASGKFSIPPRKSLSNELHPRSQARVNLTGGVMSLELYDASTIDALDWPQTEEGEYARNFLVPFIKNGSKYYIDNVDTQMMALKLDHNVIPITINEAEYDNSFICSPFSHYISYAFKVLDKFKKRYVRDSIYVFLTGFSKIMRKGKLNKVVIVNNWLFTTSPHVSLNKIQMETLTNFLKERFPSHAIVFRSVNAHIWKESYPSLKHVGYDLIASRYVWITNASKEEVFQTRICKSDMKFLRETKYRIIEAEELTEADIPKIQELYSHLYIKKYSQINPQYNENYFRLVLKNKILRVKGIKQTEKLEGVVGYSYRNGVMISSLFGYDPQDTENKGVYRLLSTILMSEAKNNGGYYNQSAGGSFYKEIRRAEGHMEYTAVYAKHLSFARKLPWKLLKGVLNTFGPKFMKKY